MHTYILHSEAVDTPSATAEILRSARERLDGEAPKAAILFSSLEYEHAEVLQGLRKEWPVLPIIGASSDGELSSELGFRHDSVLLILFCGDDLEVHCGVGSDISQGIEAAVDEALEGCPISQPGLCITLFAPSTNASEVVRVLNQRLEGPCPVVGGLSGDHREYSNFREFHGEDVHVDSIAVMVLKGDFRFSWGVGSGWFPHGESLRVTRAEDHIIHEIDGRPAIEIYRDHYGSVPSSSLGEYPLAVHLGEEAGEWALRAVLDADEETGSIRLAGEVAENASVRLTEVLPEGLLSGSTASLLNALDGYSGDEPQLALVFSCAARKWVLGTQASQEIEQLRACAAERGLPDLQIAGLYVFGEIAPFNGGRTSTFHNETCVSLVLGR